MIALDLAQAAAFSVHPAMAASYEYDTNRLLRTTSVSDNRSPQIAIEPRFDVRGERYAFAAEPFVRFRRNSDRQVRNSDEHGAALNAQYRWERMSASVNSSFHDRDAFAIELDDIDGISEGRDRRTFLAGSNLSYALSDLFSMSASFNFRDVQFAGTQNAQVSDFSFWSTNASLSRPLSDRDAASVTFFTNLLQSPGSQFESLTHGAQFSYSRSWSPTLSTQGSVGFTVSNIDFVEVQRLQVLPGLVAALPVPAEATEVGEIYTFSATKEFDKTRVSANVRRTLSPSSLGSQQTTDTYSVEGRYQLREHVDVVGNIRSSDRALQGDEDGTRDTRLTIFQFGLKWRYSERINLEADYVYRRRDSKASDQGADAHRVVVRLRYSGSPLQYLTDW